MTDNGVSNDEDVQKHIDENGLIGIEKFLKAKLEGWRKVEIKIGVTGDSGVGKSSFINAFRGLKKGDEGAARTGVTETTREPTEYEFPANKKIKLWDLPGVGSPDDEDFETYCERVGLEKYDTFLIFTASRFTKNNLLLGEKMKSIKKPFFFVRTKIDQDIDNECDSEEFKEESILEAIRNECSNYLKDLVERDKVFLISNRYTAKWDFESLTQAIQDALPNWQKESLTLSLTSCSIDRVKRKVKVLRGRIWMVAAASCAGALVPVPGLSLMLDLGLLTREMNLYKSQLRLPEESSSEFYILPPVIQEKVRKFLWKSPEEIGSFLKGYLASSTVEEFSRFLPVVGNLFAGSISFCTTYYSLHGFLNDLEKTALECLDKTKADMAKQ